MQANRGAPSREHFLLWALGASMFAHTATSISVTYYDQSFLFFYLVPAAVASVRFKERYPAANVEYLATEVELGLAHPVGSSATRRVAVRRKRFGTRV